MPNLLATRTGRLVAFFLLYVTEGIPLGLTAVAAATQMRRQGLGPVEIGGFVGSLYLPWAFKWMAGPFVDTFTSDRFGRRRFWILLTQVGMVLTLLASMPIDFVANLALMTGVIFVHNMFAATQDVAIDALAVDVLPEDERGVANGFMFAGASLGQTIGGGGVLLLTNLVPFRTTFVFVAASILLVTVFVALPLREPVRAARPAGADPFAQALGELTRFVRDAWRAFTGSRAAMAGVVVSLLPIGAHGLSLALQSNVAVELGLSDAQVGQLNTVSMVAFAIACVGGGWLSDRLGRRMALAIFAALTAVPTLGLAWAMQHAPWIMPVDLAIPNRPVPPDALVTTFWVAVVAFNACQGLTYGVRSALFMDVTTRAVAATQFTAYMALANFVITYSAWWQGLAVARWGYPMTLLLDALLGLVVIGVLPLMSGGDRRSGVIPPGATS